MRYPHGLRLLAMAAFVIVTLATVTMAVLSVRQLSGPEASGRVGVVAVTRCDRQSAPVHDCFGDFTSADGRLRLADVRISGANAAQPGDKFAGYADPATRTVTLPGGARFAELSSTLVCLVIWGALLWVVLLRPRRTAARRASGAPSSPSSNQPPSLVL